MKVTWDEPKRTINLVKHGLDLADAERFAWNEALIVPSHAGKGGRPRFKAIGRLDGDLIALIFSPLGSEAVTIVSLRRASRKERQQYAAHEPGS